MKSKERCKDCDWCDTNLNVCRYGPPYPLVMSKPKTRRGSNGEIEVVTDKNGVPVMKQVVSGKYPSVLPDRDWCSKFEQS